jgi:hypothetical protein
VGHSTSQRVASVRPLLRVTTVVVAVIARLAHALRAKTTEPATTGALRFRLRLAGYPRVVVPFLPVLQLVLPVRHHLKVLWTVVRLHAVPVVHMLI